MFLFFVLAVPVGIAGESCSFQSYVNSYEEDTAPESAAIIPADVSPSGYPLLVAAYEESNTLAVFELKFDD